MSRLSLSTAIIMLEGMGYKVTHDKKINTYHAEGEHLKGFKNGTELVKFVQSGADFEKDCFGDSEDKGRGKYPNPIVKEKWDFCELTEEEKDIERAKYKDEVDSILG